MVHKREMVNAYKYNTNTNSLILVAMVHSTFVVNSEVKYGMAGYVRMGGGMYWKGRTYRTRL